MTHMKAVQIHAYGEADVLTYEDVARPVPGPGEVLIRVRAAGINPVDYKTREGSGMARLLGENPFPLILGWDISGEIAELGQGVTEYALGDAVYGLLRFPQPGNAYAEYVTAPLTDIARKPANQSHIEAAAVPLVALTAWQALFTTANLQSGERILVHAAAGGVGHIAVQLARWKGAQVVGTASARNGEFLRELGAETVIDYTREAFEERIHDADVALDSMSGEIQKRTYQVLKRGGRLISLLGGAQDEALAQDRGIQVSGILVHPEQAQLQEITRLIEAGQLKIHVEATFPLQKVAQAHELLAKHHVRGKLVLTIE